MQNTGLTWGELKKQMKEMKASDDTVISCGASDYVPYGGTPDFVSYCYPMDCEEDRNGNNVRPKEVALIWKPKFLG